MAGKCPIHLLSHDIFLKGRAHGGMPGTRCEEGEGGTNMKGFGFFNQEGFEIVIWILVVIFLLSIFFDEGID